MNGIILAHAGGLDEMAMLLFPIVVGFGVWVLTRQPSGQENPDTPPNPSLADRLHVRAAPGEPDSRSAGSDRVGTPTRWG